MSTRSGKRIHASIESPSVDTKVLKTNRKTRSKKEKENVQLSELKRHNYVSYPTEEHTASVSSDAVDDEEKTKTVQTRRNTLKERNLHSPVTDGNQLNNDSKSVRKSRRAQKLSEEQEKNTDAGIQYQDKLEPSVNTKKRNKKKKKHSIDFVETAGMQDISNSAANKKGKKSIKKTKGLNPMVPKEKETESIFIGTGNSSVDSFHSAAGSPEKVKLTTKNSIETEAMMKLIKSESKNNSFTNFLGTDTLESSKTNVDISTKKRRKLSKNNSFTYKNDTKGNGEEKFNTTFDKSPDVTASNTMGEKVKKRKRKSSIKNVSIDKIKISNAMEDNTNRTFDKTTDTATAINSAADVSLRKRKRSSINNSTIEPIETNNLNKGNLNTTFDNVPEDFSTFNTTLDVSTRKKMKSNIKNSTFDKTDTNERKSGNDDNFNSSYNHTISLNSLVNGMEIENNENLNVSEKNVLLHNIGKSNDHNSLNSTENESNTRRQQSCVVNSTFDKVDVDLVENEVHAQANATFDKDNTGSEMSSVTGETMQMKKSLLINNSAIDSEQILTNTKGNDTINNVKTKNRDSTFKEDDCVGFNTTFDKEKKRLVCSEKSSLISSDGTINVTFDKSGDSSRSSITNDESKTENILNHTPVLIESSIDDTVLSDDKTPEKLSIPVTPLKREGTFTKEASEIVMSPMHKRSEEKTPVKRKSSPGCTPFPFSKSSQKENTKLNVTRSIEKSLRRSSLVEMVPKQTRVMFCSPANNPAVVSQMKGRVIKSNLKGSNKSFVFEDNVSSDACARRRKRSLTVGAAGAGGAAGGAEVRAKRKRLGDELQQSVDRLSRPRTQSAAAKLTDPSTPSKKSVTPSKAGPESRVGRTRLPNFAALHQKQFARMESLDECQQRRARRARQLLTPTGSVGLLERISPKGTPPEPAARPHTPTAARLPTLESLLPGYTRFGFKLHVDANPFSGRAAATERKGTDGPARRGTSAALPSLAGAAGAGGAAGGRQQAARHAVMREKSFSEKRGVTRERARTVIKGVRTNRRFELQMQLRNVNA